jgi:hypothetical protein
MAELSVRQGDLVLTINPREKQRFTWFGLRKSRSKLLDGLELRVPLGKVVGVRVGDAYWELQEQMDGRNTRRASQIELRPYQPPLRQPWIGIYHVKEGKTWGKKLCFIHGQHFPVVAVDLFEDNQAPFSQLAVTYELTSDLVAANIRAAAGLT